MPLHLFDPEDPPSGLVGDDTGPLSEAFVHREDHSAKVAAEALVKAPLRRTASKACRPQVTTLDAAAALHAALVPAAPDRWLRLPPIGRAIGLRLRESDGAAPEHG